MKKRKNEGVIWCTKADQSKGFQFVRSSGEELVICFCNGLRSEIKSNFVSRRDARLLAKRINQCLDATVRK